jgi:hypothetical protein
MSKDALKKNSTVFLSVFFVASILGSKSGHAYIFNVTPKAGTTLPTKVPYNGNVYAYYTVKNNTVLTRAGNVVRNLPPNVTQVTSGGFYANTCGVTFDLAPKGSPGDSCVLQLLVTGAVSGMPNPFVCLPAKSSASCVGTSSPLNVSVATAVNYTWANIGLSNSVYLADLAIANNQLYTGGLVTNGSSNAGQLWAYTAPSSWVAQFETPVYNSKITAVIPNADNTQLYMAEGNVGYGQVASFTPGDSSSSSISNAEFSNSVSTINDLSLGVDNTLYATGGLKTFPVIGDVWQYMGSNVWESTGFNGLELAAGYWLTYVPPSSTQSPTGLYVASYLTPAQSDTPVVYIYAGSPAVWSNTFIPTKNIDILQSLNVDPSSGLLYATGSVGSSGISRGALLTYTAAGEWVPIATPNDSESISSITFLNGALVLGGENLLHQGTVWVGDGTNGWTNTGLKNSAEVTTVTVYNGNVYASGYNDNQGEIWSLSTAP